MSFFSFGLLVIVLHSYLELVNPCLFSLDCLTIILLCVECQLHPLAPAVGMEEAKNESNKKIPRSSQRKRTPHSRTPHSSNSEKKQKKTKGSATPKRQTRKSLGDSTPAPPETEDTNGSLDISFLDDETTRG